MKKLISLFLLLFIYNISFSQELLSVVQVNTQQLAGSNQQTFKTLEKSLRDFINNTSWTGKKLQNFEKIKSSFSIVLTSKEGNKYGGKIAILAVRPVYSSNYESPLINLEDFNFEFEYVENENFVFNERQFSGKNLIDVISFYVYVILGYDADSFQSMGGTQWFAKAQQIDQNAQNRGYKGWAQIGSEGPRTRGVLIGQLTSPNMSQLRSIFYTYHRAGLDNMYNQDQTQPKKVIYDALMQLKTYENSFQQNYAFDLFITVKNDEIFNIFNSNNNGGIVLNDLKQMMMVFAPKYNDKWNKWK